MLNFPKSKILSFYRLVFINFWVVLNQNKVYLADGSCLITINFWAVLNLPHFDEVFLVRLITINSEIERLIATCYRTVALPSALSNQLKYCNALHCASTTLSKNKASPFLKEEV